MVAPKHTHNYLVGERYCHKVRVPPTVCHIFAIPQPQLPSHVRGEQHRGARSRTFTGGNLK